MSFNFKIVFKYILLQQDFLFIKNKLRNDKNTSIVITQNSVYFTILPLKLSSLFYSLQLSEFFSYELPSSEIDNLVVYNFHNITNQQRFFVFVARNSSNKKLNLKILSI